ncbi:MAG: glycosyltransferase [Candidatus Magasanikbacteria bacterium]
MKRQDRKKILFVITQGAWGGAQRYVFDLATSVSDSFDITVAVGEIDGKKELQEKLETGNWQLATIELKHLKRKISPLNDIRAIYELRKLYKTIQPDGIHLNSSKAGILGSLASFGLKNSKQKVVYTVHGWIFNEPLGIIKTKLYTFLEKITSPLKSAFIVLSPQDKEAGMKKLGIESPKIHTIPLGIEKPEKHLTKQEARNILFTKTKIKPKDEVFVFGTIAGLYKTKGLDILISAVEEKKSDLADAQFQIIGEGPEKASLEKLIQDKGLENMIHLVGYVENAAELLPAFNTFVLPSRKEGLPYTILEAKNAGVPIIATRVGGVPSMIEDRAIGLLIEPENKAGLSNALVKMYKEKKYKDSPGQDNTKNLNSLEKMIQDTVALYSELSDSI